MTILKNTLSLFSLESLWLHFRDTGHDILKLRVKFFDGVTY